MRPTHPDLAEYVLRRLPPSVPVEPIPGLSCTLLLMTPLLWWRITVPAQLGPAEVKRLRRALTGFAILGEPRWPHALVDSTAAMACALRAVMRHRNEPHRLDLTLSALLLAATGDEAAARVLAHLVRRCRHDCDVRSGSEHLTAEATGPAVDACSDRPNHRCARARRPAIGLRYCPPALSDGATDPTLDSVCVAKRNLRRGADSSVDANVLAAMIAGVAAGPDRDTNSWLFKPALKPVCEPAYEASLWPTLSRASEPALPSASELARAPALDLTSERPPAVTLEPGLERAPRASLALPASVPYRGLRLLAQHPGIGRPS